MLISIRKNVRLSAGTVTLKAWGASVADSYLSDLLTLTVTLGALRDEWQSFRRGDLEPGVWASFGRLAIASLEPGNVFPKSMNWNDRLLILEALFELNDIEEAEGKLLALTQRSARLLTRIQGQMKAAQMTAPSTNLSSESSARRPTPAS